MVDYCNYRAAFICCCCFIFLFFGFGDCFSYYHGGILGGPPTPGNSKTWIGVVLGTEYCSVSVFEHGEVKILPNKNGNLRTPPCVAFTDNTGEVLIGEDAKNQSHLNPERTICDATRLIGIMFDDDEVQRDIRMLPYKIIDKDGEPYIEVKLRDAESVMAYSPEDISAMLLRGMKEMAEDYLGRKIDGAVITVPVYFSKAQRHEAQYAASVAGIHEVFMMREPLAAVLKKAQREEAPYLLKVWELALLGEMYYLLVDIGTNRVDVTVVGCEGLMVIATRGDNHLDYFINLTNEDEEASMNLCRKITELVNHILEDAGLERSSIHEVLLAGAGSQVANVRQTLRSYFDGKEPLEVENSLVQGAAIWAQEYGEFYRDTPIQLLEPLGIESACRIVTRIVEPSRLPVRKTEMFTTDFDNQTSASIKVYQYESRLIKDWRLIGRFELSGIAPAPRGVAQIEVTFSIDKAVPFLLHVMAKDKISNKTEAIAINTQVFRSKGKVGRNVREPHEDEKIIIPVTNFDTDPIPCPVPYRTNDMRIPMGINQGIVKSIQHTLLYEMMTNWLFSGHVTKERSYILDQVEHGVTVMDCTLANAEHEGDKLNCLCCHSVMVESQETNPGKLILLKFINFQKSFILL